MSEAEHIEKIVNALRNVPEKRLLIIELANSIPIRNGVMDKQEIMSRSPEINMAIAEAKAYGGHTIMAIDALIRVKAVTD